MEPVISLLGNHLRGPQPRFFLLALLCALTLIRPLFADSESEDLFQQAISKESVARDLKGAIRLYQQTAGHPLVSPSVAGEARFRMGLCYEKLGRPVEAESVYQQLLDKTSGVNPEIVQKARAHLLQVEAENILGVVPTPSSPVKVVWVRRAHLTPLSVLVGPYLAAASQSLSSYGLSAGARWRLSSTQRPEKFYVEGRGLVPVANTTVQTASTSSNPQGTTRASLKVQYQSLFGLVAELPHGHQTMIVPEVGGGFALTATKLSYTNPAFSGSDTQKQWSPYLSVGMHVWPNQNFSLLLNASYLYTPYPQSITPSGTGSTSFSFTSSPWILTAMMQVKIGYLQPVPEIRK